MNEPIHRWLQFSDGWPPSAVTSLFEVLGVDGRDSVYDPFVGSGTTPLAAASAGVLRTWSSDRSPLAALSTIIKLGVHAPKALARLRRLAANRRLLACLGGFTSGTLPMHAGSTRASGTVFLLCAALVRAGWCDGAVFDPLAFRREAGRLAAEMECDALRTASPGADHRVVCGAFPAIDARWLKRFAGRLVMVTSPPFPGSNRNPRRERIDRLLDPAHGGPSFSGEDVDDTGEFLSLIARLVDHAAACGCRGIALEVPCGGTPRMDDETAAMIESRGYRIVLLSHESSGPEPFATVAALLP